MTKLQTLQIVLTDSGYCCLSTIIFLQPQIPETASGPLTNRSPPAPEWTTPAQCQAQSLVRNRKCIKQWSTKEARTLRCGPRTPRPATTHHARQSLAPCLLVLTPNFNTMTDLVARRKQFSSCDECRRLRVRCDALARGAGSGQPGASPVSCSRCARRSERCTFEV